jgi:hypothetical protein
LASTQTDRTGSVQSSLAMKAPVRAATTADINSLLSQGALGSGGGGLITVDGVALAQGDRVLCKNQVDATTNGIYIASTTAWQRDVDFRDNRAVAQGTVVLAAQGSTQAGLWFEVTTAPPITIGSSAITFAVTSNPTVSGAMAPVVGAATLAVARTALGLKAAAVEALGGAIVDDGAGNLTIGANAATNAMLAQMAAKTLKGNSTVGTANAADLSLASVLTLLLSGGALRSYLAGLTLANDGVTPNSVLDIAAGACADSTNTVMINLGAFTKSTAGAWVAGSGGNGMGLGLTIAASTWYHVFAIIVAGVPDVYFDTSVTAANLPASTTAFRRLGSFKTDGSSHIIAFSQNGDEFLWTVAQNNANGLTVGNSLVALTVPTGIKVNALFRANYNDTAGISEVIFLSPDETDQGPSGAAASLDLGAVSAGGPTMGGSFNRRTNTSGQIRAHSTGSTGVLSIGTNGWIDTRGRFS